MMNSTKLAIGLIDDKKNDWLNVGQTKCSLFRKSRRSDNLSLRLPSLKLNENKIGRVDSTKFLGILIDEKVSWKQHLKYIGH